MGLASRRSSAISEKGQPTIGGEASAEGKETNLQITDRGTDVKEPAGLRALSWEPPHFPGAHGALTQPLPALLWLKPGP